MGDSRRKVNFRDSPPGGSRSSRQASDSGVGSLSDPASPRAAAAQVTDDQWNDLESLQEAYRSVYKNKEHWKKKAKQSDEEIAELRKALKEREASWRGVVDRNEQLEDEKKKILKDKKSAVEKSNVERQRAEEEKENLEDENKALQDEVALLKRQLKEARRASSPTTSGGGSGGETTTKLHRSSSRRDSDKKQKERLKERFESKSSTSEATSDATSLSSKAPSSSTRARRKSYVEPFGPSSPTRAQYATYTTTPIASPLYAYAQEPTFSSVPRTERPTISVTTEQAVPDYYDDYQEPAGYYPPPPLPKQHHSSSRTSRYPR